MGLKEFQILLAEEDKTSAGIWGRIESAASTHPGTEDRIKKFIRCRTISWRALF